MGTLMNSSYIHNVVRKQEAPILGSIIIPLINANLIDIIVFPTNLLTLSKELV